MSDDILEERRVERRRDMRDLKAEIDLLKDVAAATNEMNKRLITVVWVNVLVFGFTILSILAIAIVGMWGYY